jgi:hypothetical protein
MVTNESLVISKIVQLIKKRRSEAINFIASHGGVVKKNDSDINIGKALSLVLSKSDAKTKMEFAKLLDSSLKADGDAASDAAFYTQGSVGTPIVSTQSTAGGAISGASKGAATGGTFGAILGGVTGLFGTASTNKAATQQSSDQVTLAIINAGIQKQKTPASTIIAIVVLAIIIVVIGVLIYIKSKKS